MNQKQQCLDNYSACSGLVFCTWMWFTCFFFYFHKVFHVEVVVTVFSGLIAFLITWLAPWAVKMNRILRCDWLPERARWRYLALSGLLAVSRMKNVFFLNIINSLLTKLVRSRWQDILSLFFFSCLWKSTYLVHKLGLSLSQISKPGPLMAESLSQLFERTVWTLVKCSTRDSIHSNCTNQLLSAREERTVEQRICRHAVFFYVIFVTVYIRFHVVVFWCNSVSSVHSPVTRLKFDPVWTQRPQFRLYIVHV